MHDLDVECSRKTLYLIFDLEINLKTALINVIGSEIKIDENYNAIEVLKYFYNNTTKKDKKKLYIMFEKWLSKNSYKHKKDRSIYNKDNDIYLEKHITFKDVEIKHHYEKYNCVPLWLFINKLTMGNITILIKYMDSIMLEKVASSMNNKLVGFSRSDFIESVDKMRKYRNVLAHGYTLSTIMNTNIRNPRKQDICDMFQYLSENMVDTFLNELKLIINKNEFSSTLTKISNSCNNTILNELICDLNGSQY